MKSLERLISRDHHYKLRSFSFHILRDLIKQVEEILVTQDLLDWQIWDYDRLDLETFVLAGYKVKDSCY